MTNPNAKLREYVDFVLDGSCTDQQREEFAQLIDQHPELTPEIVEQVFMHSLLQWRCEEPEGYPSDLGMPAEFALQSSDDVFQKSAVDSPQTKRGYAWLFIAASLLLLCSAVAWQYIFDGSSVNQIALAEIIESEDVVWAGDSRKLELNKTLYPGRIETTSGSFTMKFHSGPVVKVSGPSSMMIESDMLMHLDRGQATARVPEEAIGFAIKTPVIDVIDQGTEFGVAVRGSGHTDVVVFDGKVDLADSISDVGVAKRLERGEGARIDRQGSIRRIMNVGRSQVGGWWTSDYPSKGINLIEAVVDNIPPDDGSNYFFYQIAYHGFAEDALAYVDHPHQWNGLTEEGIPEFLEGADYIKTFNDYRYIHDFQMEIELSQPANLYIFFDDRVPLPAWLLDQFEDTGVDIGLDEGPWEGIPDHVNAIGPGKSIDNVFSIWKRTCEDTTPIILGPVGMSLEARAMYGIATTKLDLDHEEAPELR